MFFCIKVTCSESGNDSYYSGYQQYLYSGNQEATFSMVPEQPYQASVPVKRTIPVSDLPKINMELVMKRLRERLVTFCINLCRNINFNSMHNNSLFFFL